MRKLLLLAITAFWIPTGHAQQGTVTYTAGVPPKGAVPASITAKTPEATPTISVVITGNALPATGLIIAWTVNGVVIPSYTMPLSAGQALTEQINFGPTDAVTFIATTNAQGVISVTATANGSTSTGGVF